MTLPKQWPIYGVIGAAALIQIVLIFQPLHFLLTNLLPDDAFYYFQIARNIVTGHGSTFDALHPTNGYHPLWMLLLLPIYGFFSSGGVHDVAPIYIALGLSVLLNIGTALLFSRLLRRITERESVVALGLAVWCLNPFVIYESLNGLETSLALFLLVLFVRLSLIAVESGRTRDMVLTGIVAGLLVLARLDMACYVLAFGLYLLWRDGIGKGMRRGLFAAVPAVALISLWIAYNIIAFNMFLTSASGGNILVNHTLVTQDNGTGLWVSIKAPLYMVFTYGRAVLMRTGAPWLPVLMVAAALLLWRRAAYTFPRLTSNVAFPLALFGGFVLLFVLNAGVRFTGRSWYFISANLFLAASAVWLLSHVEFRKVLTQKVLFVFGIALLASFMLSWKLSLYNQMPNQEGMYQMAEWLDTTLPSGTRIGVFNAGIIGYFSDLQVVNLDGLVNNSAYEAMRTHSLWGYIQNQSLGYIADYPLYITYRYRSFFGIPDVIGQLTPIHEIQTPGASRGDSLVLYSIKKQ